MRPPIATAVVLLMSTACAWAADDVILLPLDGSMAGTVAGAASAGEAVGTVSFVTGGEEQGLRLERDGAVRLAIGAHWPVQEGCCEMWVKPAFRGADKNRYWLAADSLKRFRLFKYTNGRLYFQIRCDDRGVNCAAPCKWQPGQWRHVAFAWRNFNTGRDDGLMMLMVDGQLRATTTGRFTISKVGPHLFVGGEPSGEDGMHGVVADVKVRAAAGVDYGALRKRLRLPSSQDYAQLAYGATALASSEIRSFRGKSYLAAAAVDGQVAGPYWCTDFPHEAKPPHWLEVDLGQERVVGRVVLHMVKRSSTLLTRLRVEAETDGKWSAVAKLGDGQDQPAADDPMARYRMPYGRFIAELAPPRRMRRVRVTLEASGIARLHEVQVLPPAEKHSQPKGALRLGTLVCLDLGGAASPVAEGWLPLTPAMRYDQGYGWQDTDGLIGVDRGRGYDHTRDMVAGRGTHRLSLDAAPGDYAVAVVAGDLDYPAPAFTIRAEGRVVASRVGTGGAGGWDAQTFCVAVQDGALDLEFASQDAWCVSAVVLAPQAQFAKVQERVEALAEAYAKGDPGQVLDLRERMQEKQPGSLALTPKRRGRGYELFSGSCMDRVLPTAAPDESQVCRAVTLAATPGEYEPLSLLVHTFKPLRGLRVTPGPLAGPGAGIPAEAIDVRWVHCWPQITKKWNPDEFTLTPELLLPQARHGEKWVRASRTTQCWLTVHVPEQAKPGLYRGSIRVEAANAPGEQVELRLQVYPFRLRSPHPMAWGIYYYPGRERGDAIALAELRSLRAHGLNTFAFSAGPGSMDFRTAQCNLSYVQWVMGLIEKVEGFSGPFPLYMGASWEKQDFTPERRDMLVRFIRTVEAERKARGWPELLYYPVDEPFGGDRLKGSVAPYQAAHSVPGIRTYCTVSGAAADKLGPWLDVRCHSCTVSNGFLWPHAYEAARDDGDELWWYSNSSRSYFDVVRFKAGFYHWKIRATGQTYWHYQAPVLSAFCDFDGTSRDHVTAHPGLDGPIDTIQWECLREGIDDAKYAYTLAMTLDDAKKSGVEPGLIDRAKALLRDLTGRVNVDMADYDRRYGRKYAFHYYCDWSPNDIEQARRAVAAMTARLVEAMR